MGLKNPHKRAAPRPSFVGRGGVQKKKIETCVLQLIVRDLVGCGFLHKKLFNQTRNLIRVRIGRRAKISGHAAVPRVELVMVCQKHNACLGMLASDLLRGFQHVRNIIAQNDRTVTAAIE